MYQWYRWLSSTSSRELIVYEEELLNRLRGIKIGHKDVVSLGMIRDIKCNVNTGEVSFRIMTNDDRMRQRCEQIASELTWIKKRPNVEMQTRASIQPTDDDVSKVSGLERVKKIIAVHSCKGGVGKSTVAVNLACSLPGRVGLLDCDIYGPSLPTMMVQAGENWRVTRSLDSKRILPVQYHNITCMSYGFVSPGNAGGRPAHTESEAFVFKASDADAQAAILRGPMVSSVITQLATKTEWGELDYLVLDMPPGTGDIHLTLGQQMEIAGSVLVTTPQRLSFVDVVKGLQMFDKLHVPTVAVVENMSWFDGDDGKRYFPFGKGHKEILSQAYGIKHAYQLPISEDMSSCGDKGTPFSVAYPQSKFAEMYRSLAKGVVEEIIAASKRKIEVSYSEQANLIQVRIVQDDGAEEIRIPPFEIRKNLRQVDDMLHLDLAKLDTNVRPVRLQRAGNYAISIAWSDGFDASIYNFEDLIKLGKKLKET